MTTIGFTGHRPNRLVGGYDRYLLKHFDELSNFIYETFTMRYKRISHARIGMALGFDLCAAQACCSLEIPYTACVPFRNYGSNWNSAELHSIYQTLLESASKIEYTKDAEVSSTVEANRVLKLRNESICNYDGVHIDYMLALWNGETRSGTYNAVKHCKKLSIPVVNLWDLYKFSFDGIVK